MLASAHIPQRATSHAFQAIDVHELCRPRLDDALLTQNLPATTYHTIKYGLAFGLHNKRLFVDIHMIT